MTSGRLATVVPWEVPKGCSQKQGQHSRSHLNSLKPLHMDLTFGRPSKIFPRLPTLDFTESVKDASRPSVTLEIISG